MPRKGFTPNVGSNLGPYADKLCRKPSTTTQDKARRTNQIIFSRLPWAQEVSSSNLDAPTKISSAISNAWPIHAHPNFPDRKRVNRRLCRASCSLSEAWTTLNFAAEERRGTRLPRRPHCRPAWNVQLSTNNRSKGPIAPGTLADFVAADDPHTVDEEKIKDIEIIQTATGGSIVYEK